jgi:ergothioneine biosynthesis protein EgtB
MLNPPTSHLAAVDSLLHQFNHSRDYSLDLIAPLTPEDCQVQSMDDASPAKWHLAHVTWFYEVMILKEFEPDFKFWNPHFAVLFNSYYNGVGDKHPRKKRGLLTRPTLAEVLAWRSNVEERVTALLRMNPSFELQWMIELGIHHEQQHQELLLTDIQHLFSSTQLLSAYKHEVPPSATHDSFAWIEGDSGLVEVGFSGDGFHFDNEGPKHTLYLQSYSMASTLVCNQDWLLFIEAGGYQDPIWWLDEGWAWLTTEQIRLPMYWNEGAAKGHYDLFSLNGNVPLNPLEPVSNISYFEADAFARWANQNLKQYAGARLPTEFEWEAFARNKGAALAKDLFGKVWQWTHSNYAPYPGYQPWGGVAGEYNGKFMVNQMVLRGSSSYTSKGHARTTYRNFFPTRTRWQRTGLRLAKDGV